MKPKVKVQGVVVKRTGASTFYNINDNGDWDYYESLVPKIYGIKDVILLPDDGEIVNVVIMDLDTYNNLYIEIWKSSVRMNESGMGEVVDMRDVKTVFDEFINPKP